MSVKESIVEGLKAGVVPKRQLIKSVIEKEHVTVQAVYKELRMLVRDEVIIDTHKKLSLAITHIQHEFNDWKKTLETYTKNISIDDFLFLPKGKSTTLTFKNIVDLDLFWTQAFVVLERVLPEKSPTYSIVPHDWFSFARPESDDIWSNKRIKPIRLLITHPFDIDWSIARLRRQQQYEFTGGENPLKMNDAQYYTLMDDWIFEVTFDKDVNYELNAYLSTLRMTADVDAEIMRSIMNKRGVFKMKISNNPQKAKLLATKVKKYFE